MRRVYEIKIGNVIKSILERVNIAELEEYLNGKSTFACQLSFLTIVVKPQLLRVAVS